ncbi:hypothetical protein CALCODRAFT_498478 [Calocera cornea HHB12733]|uniref:Crossover junction endonuclease MUS81 n=1 Tax=Calocera cornea HHB12733 TaxID=1353952 RepID=A0A165EV39_9BASI|nr:hypothetical protein CALCODRAFT_498478 [Calocera cornea HHB12733]
MSLNALLAAHLLELRDKHEAGSNRYKTFNKAYNGVRGYEQDIHRVQEAIHVPGIGTTILRALTTRLEKGSGARTGAMPGPSGPIPRSYVPEEALIGNPFFDPSMLNIAGVDVPAPVSSRGRARGRPRGSSTTSRAAGPGRAKRTRADAGEDDDVMEGSPPKKWSPGKARQEAGRVPTAESDAWAVPTASSAPIVPSPFVASAEARFWYLDTSNTRVPHYAEAEIHVHAPFIMRKVELPISPSVPGPPPSPFKLIFLEGQPLWTKAHSIVAWVEEERLLEKSWERCLGFQDMVHAPPRIDPRATLFSAPSQSKPAAKSAPPKDDLASLLAQEARNKIKTLDPSRTGLSRTEAAPRPFGRTPSSDGPEFLSDPIDVKRSAGDAAARRQQAAQAATARAEPPLAQAAGKDRVPSRTTSAPLPKASASVPTSIPPRTASAPFFPTPRVSIGNPSFPVFSPIIIPADTYDIVLVLDNREVGRYGNRTAIRDGLEKLGVAVEQESLAVGDTVWIARSRRTGTTCVLNWIVERKRLDDLCASVKDGRFQDQKFRLSQSGLTHVFYVVEHFAAKKFMESNPLLINTALSRTQVVDEFQVKETKSQQETIEFLASMHLAIQTILAGKSVYVLPSSVISRPTYMAFQAHLRQSEPEVEYVPSWSDFQSLNGKNATRTVGETWARMLLCIKGMSAERASWLLEHFGTSREMWEAYRKAENVEAVASQQASEVPTGKKGKKQTSGPKTMLVELGGDGRRKVTNALSEKVHEVMMDRTYQ